MTIPRRLAAAGLLTLTLTACGAGLDAQTYQTRAVADASNVDLGALAVRNITVTPPSNGRTYEAGGEARGLFTVTNNSAEPDQLVEVTSPQAEEVVITSEGVPGPLEVPGLGTTGSAAGFVLRGLSGDLVAGEYVTLVFRFERAGSFEVLVPVAVTGRTQRPGRTGEPGSEEGEPALQGPAGGHSEGGAEGEGAEGEGAEGAGGAGAEAPEAAESEAPTS